jgi:hypothetical protein
MAQGLGAAARTETQGPAAPLVGAATPGGGHRAQTAVVRSEARRRVRRLRLYQGRAPRGTEAGAMNGHRRREHPARGVDLVRSGKTLRDNVMRQAMNPPAHVELGSS